MPKNELIEIYHKCIYYVLNKDLRSLRNLWGDLYQDAMVYLIENEIPPRLAARAAKFVIIDEIRKYNLVGASREYTPFSELPETISESVNGSEIEIPNNLTRNEKTFLSMFLAGYTNDEIAEKLTDARSAGTEKHNQIMELAAQGLTNSEIASRLNISRPTALKWRKAAKPSKQTSITKSGVSRVKKNTIDKIRAYNLEV